MCRFNTLRALLLFAGIAAILSSCSKLFVCRNRDTKIRINVTNISGESTKAPDCESRRIIHLGDNLILEETISSTGFAPSTKGSVVTTNGYNKINSTGNCFSIEGWLGPEAVDSLDRHFFSDNARFSGSQWLLDKQTFWTSSIPSTFWSFYLPYGCPKPVVSWPGTLPTEDQLKELSFVYTLPSPTSAQNDAYASRDLLVSYNREIRKINNDGSISVDYGTGTATKENTIGISFHHPLAALKFVVGTINGSGIAGENEYVEIEKIELHGVASRGSFVAKGSNSSDLAFTCVPSDTTTYAQQTTRAQIAGGSFSNDNAEYIFFMLPQNLDKVTVGITLKKRQKNYVHSSTGEIVDSTYTEPKTIVKEAKINGAWKSGKYYTYKLSPLVYFGGEELKMDPNKLEVSDTTRINLTEDGLTFFVEGRGELNEWIAPLSVSGIKIVKLSFTHSYSNNSQSSFRQIWLENVILNPAYVEGGTEPKYIPDGTTSSDTDLVAEAKALGYTYYWPDNHYTGFMGDATLSGKKWLATTYDKNMNDKGSFTNVNSSQFFYLGGKFSFIRIHFVYNGDTGKGAGNWTAKYPTFNIMDTVE